ncbi:MAG TPA: CYTH domain-containing protein [Myxococcota bacterium]|nr:CYTH domain-containing protein [Myxococcota bacterium]HQP94919.1 CYTH domain-containing protein [Myxococcota bacterium]
MDQARQAIEREVKLTVDGAADYLAMASALPVPRRWGLQLNVYLDTLSRRLRSNRISLRIRVTPDFALLTLKTPARSADSGDGVFCNLETEVPFDREMAVEWINAPERAAPASLAGFEALATVIADEPLVVIGWSMTRRAVCDTAWGVTLELDETVFPDGTRDFEIEAEHEDAALARRVIDLHADRVGLRLGAQTRSKHARAMERLGSVCWVLPCGSPEAPHPPLFPSPAPARAFGLVKVGVADPVIDSTEWGSGGKAGSN